MSRTSQRTGGYIVLLHHHCHRHRPSLSLITLPGVDSSDHPCFDSQVHIVICIAYSIAPTAATTVAATTANIQGGELCTYLPKYLVLDLGGRRAIIEGRSRPTSARGCINLKFTMGPTGRVTRHHGHQPGTPHTSHR